ncbi:MAG TPA: cupin, partial [Microthrixaceae bacterium]|nr:cupin [Microthrixaceae bacterium]
MSTIIELAQFPVHLGLGATVVELPEFDGTPDWYQRYGECHANDGVEGRLVSMYTFSAPWESWEVHPLGHELVVCTSGRITLHQEVGDEVRTVTLEAGQAAVNEPGVWHTADVDDEA